MKFKPLAKLKRHDILRALLVILVIITTLLLVAGAVVVRRFEARHSEEPVQLGVSFSIKYAREMELDPRQALLALMEDLQIRQFRFMSYWDEIEAERGRLDFTELDWQMEQAARTGSRVTLAIGMRQPRWPECHVPEWAKQLSADQRRSELKRYIAQVVNRYKYHPSLISWQLENEALNTVFGECSDFNRDRLVEEFELVNELDDMHPVMVSVSNEYGLPLGQPIGEIVGFSMYHTVYDNRVLNRYIHYPFTPGFFKLRAAVIEELHGSPVQIHELQAEPWGPVGTRQLSLEEQDKSMNPAKMRQSVEFAKDTGIRYMDLWGGEWWYWRKVKFNDPGPWEAAREIFNGI